MLDLHLTVPHRPLEVGIHAFIEVPEYDSDLLFASEQLQCKDCDLQFQHFLTSEQEDQ